MSFFCSLIGPRKSINSSLSLSPNGSRYDVYLPRPETLKALFKRGHSPFDGVTGNADSFLKYLFERTQETAPFNNHLGRAMTEISPQFSFNLLSCLSLPTIFPAAPSIHHRSPLSWLFPVCRLVEQNHFLIPMWSGIGFSCGNTDISSDLQD